MGSLTIESKRLALRLNENADQYVTGELDLNETLDKTDQLFNQILEDKNENRSNASIMLHDSNLMKTQTRLARQRARYYKPDSLIFSPADFALKMDQLYNNQSNTQPSSSMSQRMDDLLWSRMGDEAKKLMYSVPTFNYIYGTFDAEPIEVVKKKRKAREKDKVGEVTKPHSMSLQESSDKSDQTINAAQKVLSVFYKLNKKNEVCAQLTYAPSFIKIRVGNPICYFEFVTDPKSFSRTVENIFIVSLLVSQGCIKMISDTNGLPCLDQVTEKEKKERNPAAVKQCIVSLTKNDWKEIVQTFNLTEPLIPPPKTSTAPDSTT